MFNLKKVLSLSVLIIVLVCNAYVVENFLLPGSFIDDGLTRKSNGVLYGSTYATNGVYEVTPAGELSIFSFGVSNSNGVALDHDENLYVAASGFGKVFRYNNDSNDSIVYADVACTSLAIDPFSDTLYVSQYSSSSIVKVSSTGEIIPFVNGQGLNGPCGIVFDENGSLYVANYNNGAIFSVSSGGEVTLLGQIPGACGFITYANGKIFASGISVHKVYELNLADTVLTHIAGTGIAGNTTGNAMTSQFNRPNGLWATADGDTIYVSDFGSKSVRMIINQENSLDEEINNGSPSGFHLKQNYPNPFNPETTIEYSIPEASKISLKVYNSLGKEVAVLSNEFKNAGTHSVNFNASNLISGVYIYKLQSDDLTLSKKLMLIK